MRSAHVERGVGCASMLPAAFIGLAALTDGAGPTGWRGFAELLGWFVVCALAAFLASSLLAQGGRAGARGYALAMAAVAAFGVFFYYLVNWLGLGAPMSAKVLFTSSLQVIGPLGAGVCAICAAYACWPRHGR